MLSAATPLARDDVKPRPLLSYVWDSKMTPLVSVTLVIKD